MKNNHKNYLQKPDLAKQIKTLFLSRCVAALLLVASTHFVIAAGPYSDTAVSPTGTANTSTGEITLSSTEGLTTNSPLTYSNAGGASITYAWASGTNPVAYANVNTSTDIITGNTTNMTNGTALTYTANGPAISSCFTETLYIPISSVNLTNDTVTINTTGMYVGLRMIYSKGSGAAMQYTAATSTNIPSPSNVQVTKCGAITSGTCPAGANAMKFTLVGAPLNLTGSGNNSQSFSYNGETTLPSTVYASNVSGNTFRLETTSGGGALNLCSPGNNGQTFSYTANPPLPTTVYPLSASNPFGIALTIGGAALTLTNAGNAAQTFSYFPLIYFYPLDGSYSGSATNESRKR